MNLNTLEEMADIIAAIKAGETVTCRTREGVMFDVDKGSFTGNFATCVYRRLSPKPREVWLLPGWNGTWKQVVAGTVGACHFREV